MSGQPPVAGGLVLQRPVSVSEAVRQACPEEWRHLLGEEVNVSFAPGMAYKGQCVAVTSHFVQLKLTSPGTGQALRVTVPWDKVVAIEQPWRVVE